MQTLFTNEHPWEYKRKMPQIYKTANIHNLMYVRPTFMTNSNFNVFITILFQAKTYYESVVPLKYYGDEKVSPTTWSDFQEPRIGRMVLNSQVIHCKFLAFHYSCSTMLVNWQCFSLIMTNAK